MISPERTIDVASGRVTATERTPKSAEDIYRNKLEGRMNNVSAIIVIPAIHGLEPDLLGVLTGLKINQQLQQFGIEPKKIILPIVPGRKEYDTRIRAVVADEFPDQIDNIYHADYGKILVQTEYSKAGYQEHVQNVADYQQQTQNDLRDYLQQPFSATSLSGKNSITIEPDQELVEINTGANVVAAKEGEQTTHHIFPVEFHDLLTFVEHDPSLRETYDKEALKKAKTMARVMQDAYATRQLPHFHTMRAEDWFDTQGKLFVPYMKEPKTPPEDTQVFSDGTIFGSRYNPESKSFSHKATQYDPEKGLVYFNVSGGGMGMEAASMQAERLSKQGYGILAPSWMVEERFPFAVASGPNALYLKNENGQRAVEAFAMRAGFGSLWNSFVADVPPLIIAADLFYENPEMAANVHALAKDKLGLIFSTRRSIMDEAKGLSANISAFEESTYETYYPHLRGLSGPEIAAKNILDNLVQGESQVMLH